MPDQLMDILGIHSQVRYKYIIHLEWKTHLNSFNWEFFFSLSQARLVFHSLLKVYLASHIVYIIISIIIFTMFVAQVYSPTNALRHS